MKSKLSRGALPSVTLVACAAWWIGCGGTSVSGGDVSDGGGPGEGGSSETGASPDGGNDAPAEGVDAAITGPFVDIQYKNCATFAACGGDPKGLWHVTGGCVPDGAFAAAKAQCPGLTESNVMFQARGTIYADGTNVTRNTEVKFTASLFVPKVCKDMVGTMCSDLDAIIKLGGIGNATCKNAATAGDCTCDVSDSTKDSTADTYTTAGNTLTSGGRTYDYCVAGNKIEYKETTAKSVPAVFALAK
jgi:hypothetical protein